MKQSHANVVTTHGNSYLKQLCRHWGHKFPVEFNDTEGTIQLPQAQVRLTASDAELVVLVEMPDETDQTRIEQVVAEHLQRFGFRETLTFDWVRISK